MHRIWHVRTESFKTLIKLSFDPKISTKIMASTDGTETNGNRKMFFFHQDQSMFFFIRYNM